MLPGQPERRSHDYKRHGTTSLVAALDTKTSQVLTQFHQRQRSVQFREFLDLIDASVPAALDVHIIMDNSSTHKTPLIQHWFAKRPAHIQHMQKALMRMNLQLHHAVTDITSATGMRILRALVAGERAPEVLAALLRIAAVNVGRTQTALGAFYRRLAARVGKAQAVTATARKLAVLFYKALRFGMAYADPGISAYEA
jgi:hypothetical protein